MGNSNSAHSLIVDFHAPDTTYQLLKAHLTNQKLSVILKHPPSTLSSASSITMFNTNNGDEQKIYASLVNNKDHAIITRVWVAQCKIVGFGTQKNATEGFRELYQLKDHKEAYYPLACYYYDQSKYKNAYHYFYLLRKGSHFAQYRLALMLFHNQHNGGTSAIHHRHQKALDYMKLSATNQNKYAQFFLGFYYEHGIFVKRSIKTAKTWYERSAYQGFAEAQAAIGNLLMKQIDTTYYETEGLSDEAQLIKEQALDWLNKAKDQENASALIRLGALHEEGILVSKDVSFSIDCYKRATEAPFTPLSVSSLAHYLVGIKYRLGDLGLGRDYVIALKHLTLSADAGYVPALRALGLMYSEGIGVPQDKRKANDLFQKAASQGDIRSLGLMTTHQVSKKRKSTTSSAVTLYEKAAKAGSLSSQLSLAELLQYSGQYALAFQWFQTAASDLLSNEQEDKISVLDLSVGFITQRNIARLMVARYIYNGWGGVIRDRMRAFKEFESLSKAGFSDAHYWLAACYEEGVTEDEDTMAYVVEPDLKRAYGIYMQSAKAGDVDGQFQIAYMMSNSIGCTKNLEDALVWYTRAAEQGHTMAQLSVGMYYEHGLVNPIDLDIAKKWYQLAAANNETKAMVKLAKVLVELDHIQDAFQWLRKAIDGGNVPALRELANLYINSLTNEKNESLSVTQRHRLAFGYYQKAAEKNDALSWHALSKFYEGSYEEDEDEAIVPVSFEKAVMCLTKAEELGCSTAVIDLADLYHRYNLIDEAMSIYARLIGRYPLDSTIGMEARLEAAKLVVFESFGIETDRQRAYSWLLEIKDKASTLSKCPEVLEIIGYCSENGIGTSMNRDKAIEYYLDCVNMVEKYGHWEKQRCLCRLVNIYMEERNYRSAFAYLEVLKPNLDQMSQLPFLDATSQAHRMRYYFGYILLHGLGPKKSINESIAWLKDAADEGDSDAAYELGRYLHCQQELEKEAGSRYRQGSLAGHAGCMRELALLLLAEETDKSVLDEDYDGGAEIRDLLVNASELGDREAMYRLGQAYENGLGDIIPKKDISKAMEYYTMAANEQHEWAMIRVSEILGNFMNQHEKAIEWLQRAAKLFASLKARVMLISYEFHGLHNNTDYDRNTHNFALLQNLVDQGIEMIKPTSIDGDDNAMSQREREERLSMRKNELGLVFYILGQCYELGRGTTPQLSSAKELYQRSALISQNAEAMWRLGVVYSTVENNDIGALEWFHKAAETGNHCDSHYQLGLFHLNGLAGLEVNTTASKKHFSKAAEGGHPMATYELARLVWHKCTDYFYGYELYKLAGHQLHVPAALRELGHLSHTGFISHGITIVDRDYKRAFALYCEAAQMGDPTASLMVGNYFEQGYLPEELGQDCDRALQWYESAYRLNCGGLAELAIAKLKHILADTIVNEEEAEDMREEAFEWFESVANDSTVQYARPARIMIALYYINGWGRKTRGQETGFEMLLRIAESGGFEALIHIAECYEEGVGTERDMKKALKHWEMAAEYMNDKTALLRLGEMYELGLTGKMDQDLADHYYHRVEASTQANNVYNNKTCSSSSNSSSSVYSSSSL